MKRTANQTVLSEFHVADGGIIAEASRCLDCFDPPCQKACPASIPIPLFIRSLRSGNLANAARLVREANPMAAVCGAICPQEVFCQSVCNRAKIDAPLKIRELHRRATSFERVWPRGEDSCSGKGPARRVAVIGAGPAGLSCGVRLAEEGLTADIHEQFCRAGGTAAQTIPQFRLSDEALRQDLEYVRGRIGRLVLDSRVEEPRDLLKDYGAVFLSTGLPLDRKPGIKGEDLPGVSTALAFLAKSRGGESGPLKGKKVVVIGGGNVSLDVASTAADLGASEVRILYRRGPREIKAWKNELENAERRGVFIEYQVAPLEFVAKSGRLSSVRCVATRLCDERGPDGRRTPEPVAGTEFNVPADLAIISIGLTSDFRRDLRVNPDFTTSMEGVFAGGDWARGEGTIVEAVRDGGLAAQSIIKYLRKGK